MPIRPVLHLPVAARAAAHGSVPGPSAAAPRGRTQGSAAHPLLPERSASPIANCSVAPRTASVLPRSAVPGASGATRMQNESVLTALLAVRSRLAAGSVPLRLSHPEPQLGRALDTALRGWMALATEASGR
jgi:hypothetical protein